MRKILSLPENQRTPEQTRQLEKMLGRLGRQSLNGHLGHKLSQPTQRQLAERQAKRNQERGL